MITSIIATLTLVSHIFFVVLVAVLIFHSEYRKAIYTFVNKYVLHLLFATSLGAAVGSLLYSNVIGYPPCELCWIQRIFMYPQVIISLIALTKRDKNIVNYLLPLSILGGIVAFYHSLTHFGLGDGLVGCTSALGDCGKLYVFEFGYITIPFMSLTVFVYLILISFIYKKSLKNVG